MFRNVKKEVDVQKRNVSCYQIWIPKQETSKKWVKYWFKEHRASVVESDKHLSEKKKNKIQMLEVKQPPDRTPKEIIYPTTS